MIDGLRVCAQIACAPLFAFLMLIGAHGLSLSSGAPPVQAGVDTIVSEHVRISIPMERQWLGRDVIMDLERCFRFMNGATDDSLPRRLLVVITWDESESSCNHQKATISVGMNQAAAGSNARGFLMHAAARETARMGLLGLSQGAEREEAKFLFEGMAEILAHEYESNSRGLDGAWVISRLLDEMKMLGLAAQSSWTTFSGGRHYLRSAAPGITLLTTCRELHGRARVLKLFEFLRRGRLNESLEAAFKTPAAVLENTWLNRVREYSDTDDILVPSGGDVPQLLQVAFVPEAGRPGAELPMQLFFKDTAANLLPDGVFIRDMRTGRVLQARAPSDKAARFIAAVIPIEADCPPGQYDYRVTAVDETGNVRHWKGSYGVAGP